MSYLATSDLLCSPVPFLGVDFSTAISLLILFPFLIPFAYCCFSSLPRGRSFSCVFHFMVWTSEERVEIGWSSVLLFWWDCPAMAHGQA